MMLIIGGNIYCVFNPMLLSLSTMHAHAASRFNTCSYSGNTITMTMFIHYTIVTMLCSSDGPMLQYSMVNNVWQSKKLLPLSHIKFLLYEVVYHISLKSKFIIESITFRMDGCGFESHSIHMHSHNIKMLFSLHGKPFLRFSNPLQEKN